MCRLHGSRFMLEGRCDKCDEFNQEIEADASLFGKDWSHDDLNYAAMKESEDE